MNIVAIKPFERHEIARVSVSSNTVNQYKFDTINILQNKKIKGIALYKSSYISVDETGKPNGMTPAVLSQAFLTLKTTNGTEKINKLPAYIASAGLEVENKFFPLNDEIIDWENSYFNIPAGALAANSVILLGVYFEDKNC